MSTAHNTNEIMPQPSTGGNGIPGQLDLVEMLAQLRDDAQHDTNGARPSSPWPYTQPAALELLEGLRDDLQDIAGRVEHLVETAETAVEFVGARVEMARQRERRRARRGTRKAVR